MRIFELNGKVPTITLEGMMVPEFKVLYEKGDIGFKILQYVYFSTDYKSLYLSYPSDIRDKKIIEDYIQIKNWKPDAETKLAIEKYKEFQKTESLGLLEDARYALEKIRGYYKSIDFNKRDTKGNQLFKITDVTRSVGDISKVIESLDKLTDKVRKEQDVNRKARGEGDGSYFESK